MRQYLVIAPLIWNHRSSAIISSPDRIGQHVHLITIFPFIGQHRAKQIPTLAIDTGISISPGSIMQTTGIIHRIAIWHTPKMICKQTARISFMSELVNIERPRSIPYSDVIIEGRQCIAFAARSLISCPSMLKADCLADIGCVLFDISIIPGRNLTVPSVVMWRVEASVCERSWDELRESPKKGMVVTSMLILKQKL